MAEMKQKIKHYIKQRGYTYQKIAQLLGYTTPTLHKLIEKYPNTVFYAVRGLPDVSHIKAERLANIRP
jgi:transcriptional regulator with XRE-family HTH domain